MDSRLHQTCQRALDTYGEAAQTDMMIEEASELIVALQQLKRGRGLKDDVVEELADVAVMLKQMSMVYGEGAVAARIEEKRERLERRLDRLVQGAPQ